MVGLLQVQGKELTNVSTSAHAVAISFTSQSASPQLIW